MVERRRDPGLLRSLLGDNLPMQAMKTLFEHPALFASLQSAARLASLPFARDGVISSLPGLSGWTMSRDFPALPRRSFRAWWRDTRETP